MLPAPTTQVALRESSVMWGNISKHVGAAIQKVQKLQNELESQLDAAVGADDSNANKLLPESVITAPETVTAAEVSTVKVDEKLTAPVEDANVPTAREEVKATHHSVEPTDDNCSVPLSAQAVTDSAFAIGEDSINDVNDGLITAKVHNDTNDDWDFNIKFDEVETTQLLSVKMNDEIIPTGSPIIEASTSVEIIPTPIPAEIGHHTNGESLNIVDASSENPILYLPTPPTAADSASQSASVVPEAVTPVKAKKLKPKSKTKANVKSPEAASPPESLQGIISPSKAIVSPLQLELFPENSEVAKLDAPVDIVDDFNLNLKQPTTTTSDEATPISTNTEVTIVASISCNTDLNGGVNLQGDVAMDIITVSDRMAEIVPVTPSVIEFSDDTEVTYEQNHEEIIQELEAKHQLALSGQRKSFEEAIQRIQLENEAQNIADKSLADFYALAQSEMKEVADTKDNAEWMTRIDVLTKSLEGVKKELADAITIGTEKNSTITKLQQENLKMSEIVTDRERALETSAVKMSESHKQLEAAQRRILDLGAELVEKDSKLRQNQVNSVGESDLKKQLQRAQEIMKEKEERLAAFEQEGQNLAKKQSEMEKVVRTTKAEVKKRDGDIVKLKESKEQLVKAIEEMQDLVRKNELEASSATKSLSAMQAVSQASTDKLSRLEGDINSKADELLSQRRAMEAAWAENNESKRVVAELRADRDDLRRQIGLGTSKVMETESSRRDIEQREAVLRATNKQLQDSLQRQMQESSVREERLRDEVGEMRKRWQEAITSRETLSSELSSATAPLLRQISSMQDSMRMKGESWQSVEASLSERALRAESVAEIAENRKSFLEDQTNQFIIQVGLLTTRLQESTSSVQLLEAAVDSLKKTEISNVEKINDLESRLALEIGQRQSFQSSLRELELRHKIDQQDAKEVVDRMSQQGEGQIFQLKAESQALRDQLESERKGGVKRNGNRRISADQEKVSFPSSSGRSDLELNGAVGSGTEGLSHTVENDDGSRSTGSRYGSVVMQDSVLPSKSLFLSLPELE